METLKQLLDELPEDLARRAFCHSSWVERRIDSYERLAFLGESTADKVGLINEDIT